MKTSYLYDLEHRSQEIYPVFIQASMSKIQGFFQGLLKASLTVFKDLKLMTNTYRYKRGVCRPLEEESSFCLGLSTRPVSEIVPVCLNPRFLVLITLL